MTQRDTYTVEAKRVRGFPITKRVATDQTLTNNVTPTNVTNLAWPIGANETWVYRLSLLIWDGLDNTGLQISVNAPSGFPA